MVWSRRRHEAAPPLRTQTAGIVAAVVAASIGTFLVAVLIAAGLATFVFWHADRHGNRHATAWGVLTFLAALIALPVYFLTYWLSRRRDR